MISGIHIESVGIMPKKGKKVLLIPPTITAFEQQQTKRDSQHNWWSPHYGVIRLASYLNRHGHEAEYFDTIIELLNGEDNYEKKLKEKEWDIIGVSILDTTLVSDIKNIYLAKKHCPKALIVAGGIEAQFNYQTILDKSPCRIVILGEGERALRMLADDVPWGDIPGIALRNNAVPLTQEEFWDATIGIEWEDVPYERYWDLYIEKFGGVISEERDKEIHTIRIFSKNRCPFRCKYCSSTRQIEGATGGAPPPITTINNEHLIEIIKRVQKAHPRVKTIYFTDDDFCYDKKNVIDFCKRVVEMNTDLTFMCQTRITDLNEDIIPWMVKAKFRQVNIGIESFSQNVLTEIDKLCKRDVMFQNLDLCEKYGLKAGMFMILVTPLSSLDDLEETVDETLRRIQSGHFYAGFTLACIPLKGTPFYEMYTDYLTDVIPIEGTKYTIKKDLMILAKDPAVREVQLRHYHEIDSETERALLNNEKFHKTNFNRARISLQFMKRLINEVRMKHGLKRAVIDGVQDQQNHIEEPNGKMELPILH